METLFLFLHATLMDLRYLTYAQIKEILKPWADIKKAAVASLINGFFSAVEIEQIPWVKYEE